MQSWGCKSYLPKGHEFAVFGEIWTRDFIAQNIAVRIFTTFKITITLSNSSQV